MEEAKIRQIKSALLKCAEENRNKPTPTFNQNISALCTDAELSIRELEAQVEKMKDCLNKWYNQHNIDDYTETFYDNLLRDTEKYLWGDSENDKRRTENCNRTRIE